MEVYKAIAAVMAHMAKEGISKDRKNSTQGYNFRGIDDVYNALSSVLSANGLVILPFVQNISREERQTKNGGALNYTILTVDFSLVSSSDGSTHVVRTIGEAMDSADKSANKAQSAALKYAALQVFMIPTEGDNDADATTHDLAPNVTVSAEQLKVLRDEIDRTGADLKVLCKFYKIESLPELPAHRFEHAQRNLASKPDAAPAQQLEAA